MNTPELLDQATILLKEYAVETKKIEPHRLDVVINAEHLLDAVGDLVRAHWGYLISVMGLDPGPATGQLEVLYHFGEGAAVVALRVRIPREQASIPSIQGIIPPASFFERELSEMFGIRVGDIPGDAHLFLPEDWPNGSYPLRKDWKAASTTTGEAVATPG